MTSDNLSVVDGALIMVVDDDQDIRESIESLLIDEGYRVATASHGQHALEVLQGELPRLILLDLMMPVMSGWQFRAAQKLDPRLSQIPTVVLSGAPEVKETARALDATNWLHKPISLEELLDTVRRYC